VESYQSLFLKAWFPLEFMVGVINNFGGFYPSWVYLNEARISGAILHPPCVNNSEYKTSIRGKEVWLGFIHIANLEASVGKTIAEIRPSNQPFTGLEDFIRKVPITLDQLIILIRTGAFSFTEKPKASLLWEAHMLLGKTLVGPTRRVAPTLFSHRPRKFTLPELENNMLSDVYDEIEMLGFPVSYSWFDLLETSFRGDIPAGNMSDTVGRTVRMMGLLVTIKYVRTVKKEWMHFGTFIDMNGHFFDTVHFPVSVKNYPFRGDGIYLVKGKIVEEFGFPSLEVEKMAKMPLKKDPRVG
jgi:DNA polymerase III alpha subunit